MNAQTLPTLDTLATSVGADPGLQANASQADIDGGVAAARLMNIVITQAIEKTGVNTDGALSPADLRTISRYIRADDALYAQFVEGHGDDDGNEETGFHLVQGDGGTLKFQGRNFVNTVADAIYHVGFAINKGRFVNEDGNQNEEVADVAGWLNYYVNGENRVYGTNKSETLYSGTYGTALVAAENELFLAYGGNDGVYSGDGDDTVMGGNGHDTLGGGAGDDDLHGERGNDKIWVQEGNDLLVGGAGHDELGGHTGNDTLDGGRGHDKLWAGQGDDMVMGGSGNDTVAGHDGDDSIAGGAGHDQLGGGAGNDTVDGGTGRDTIWSGDGDDSVMGGAQNDRIGTGSGADTVDAGAGRDTVWGGDGTDMLVGGVGRDEIGGGHGDDTVDGGAGRDTLTGGDGNDVFIGGAGRDELLDWEKTQARDMFVFAPGDTGLGGARDVIKGFDAGLDVIDLTGFGGLDFVVDAAFNGAGAQARVSKDLVQIDADGDGIRDAEISVLWVGLLQEGDFLL